MLGIHVHVLARPQTVGRSQVPVVVFYILHIVYFDCIQIISMSCGPTHLLGMDYAPLSNFTAHFVW